MIQLTICAKDKTIDVALDPQQTIQSALSLLKERSGLKIDDEYEVMTSQGRRINAYLRFTEAEIYSGEKLIIR